MQNSQVKETQNQTPSMIGAYHYNIFCSAYGAPMYLKLYKFEFLWSFFQMIYLFIAFSFKPFPAFNMVIDKISTDDRYYEHPYNRVAFIIYWFPTILYFMISILAISDFLCPKRLFAAIVTGTFAFLWHFLYFMLFWVAPSISIPSNISEMGGSAGWYWSELMVNLILVVSQILTLLMTQKYHFFTESKFMMIQKDIISYFKIIKVADTQDIYFPVDQEHNPTPTI